MDESETALNQSAVTRNFVTLMLVLVEPRKSGTRASGRSAITNQVAPHLSELPCLQVIMLSELEQQLISEEHLCDTLNNVRPPSFAPQTMMKGSVVGRA